MKVDIGFVGGPAVDVAAAARAADDAGWDALWAPEINHDPFLQLAIASQHSERIGLGTNIAVAFARSPMNLAVLARDLQAQSDGRFLLGLGSQIKAHITRRYSMPWSKPAARMRELVLAVRHIWACWDGAHPLDFRGDFYEHTLMTPFFEPGPSAHGDPPILLAGVGERMTEVAGEVADGFLAHGFTTPSYLREVTIPALERGLARSGRSRHDLQVSLPAFVVTGVDAEGMAAAAAAVRGQIAFYATTPTYRGVLDHHGWGDLQAEVNALAKAGRWEELGAPIDDEVLSTFAVVAEPDRIAAELDRRFGDVCSRLSFYAPYPIDPSVWTGIAADLRSGVAA